MKESYPQWVYHLKHDAKIVQSDEVKALQKDGWEDSPAKCVEPKKKAKKSK